MARKFLQMGWTRARRYANHPSGRKYDPKTKEVLPRGDDAQKAEAARIFYARYVEGAETPRYQELKREHLERYRVSLLTADFANVAGYVRVA